MDTNAQPIPRDKPYVWATWLRSLLSGEASCEWAAWFKAHYKHIKRPSKIGDAEKLAQWQIEHATLLAQTRDKLRADGYTVFSEHQNMFKVHSPIGILAGKPDLIATKDGVNFVIDVKTKPFKVRDRAQVMTYMWALPYSDLLRCKGKRFDGRLVGPGGDMWIAANEIDQAFIDRIRGLLRKVCGDVPLLTAPSSGECYYCDINADDCSDRIDEMPASLEEITDAF